MNFRYRGNLHAVAQTDLALLSSWDRDAVQRVRRRFADDEPVADLDLGTFIDESEVCRGTVVRDCRIWIEPHPRPTCLPHYGARSLVEPANEPWRFVTERRRLGNMTRIEDDDVEDEWPRIEPVGSRRRNGVKLKWSERAIRHFYQSQMEQATAQAGGETVIGLVSLAELPPSSRGKWGRGYDIVSKLDFRTDRRRKKVRTKAGAFMQVEATQDRTLPPNPVGRPRKYHGTNAERRVNRYAARTPMKGLPHAATAGTHDNLVGLDSSTDAPVNAKATD